ncbi:MAG TPA: hypothetical protein VH092_23255, partial [Urbifossiella sp.]|nr:hypothetical protein [Urbifossiella sp.]
MPVRVEIDTPARLVRANVHGPANLTAAEFADFLGAMTAHPDFRPGFDILYDRRAVAEPPNQASVRAALGAIEARADRLAGCRWAVVIGPQPALEIVHLTTLLGERSGILARPF